MRLGIYPDHRSADCLVVAGHSATAREYGVISPGLSAAPGP